MPLNPVAVNGTVMVVPGQSTTEPNEKPTGITVIDKAELSLVCPPESLTRTQ